MFEKPGRGAPPLYGPDDVSRTPAARERARAEPGRNGRAGSPASPGVAAAWLAAVRPRTLPAAVVPVVVGLAAASREVRLDLAVGVATLVAALLIQIATNLANDLFDFRKGADTAERVGPVRVVQAGWIPPAAVARATAATLALATAIGAWLVTVGGWPILAVGVVSLVCAIAYTGGPWPIAYHGLGEVFVFLFFGVVAVNGTAYLQTGGTGTVALVASASVGFLAAAILVVNNLRDVATDRRAHKRTLAVRIGERATRGLYAALVVAAFAAAVSIAGIGPRGAAGVVFAVPLAAYEIASLGRRDGAALNASLAGTARLHIVFGVLLAAGLAA